MPLKKSQIEVIEDFKQVHGNRYDYSQVKYKNVDTKITIICNQHGSFEQTPYNHRISEGCPTCSGRLLTQAGIIEEFKKVHGDKYDYSQVKYINTHTKVTLICKQHGSFQQTPHKHKRVQGCPLCFGNPIITQKRILEEFETLE